MASQLQRSRTEIKHYQGDSFLRGTPRCCCRSAPLGRESRGQKPQMPARCDHQCRPFPSNHGKPRPPLKSTEVRFGGFPVPLSVRVVAALSPSRYAAPSDRRHARGPASATLSRFHQTPLDWGHFGKFNSSRAPRASASFWIPSEASVGPSTPHVS
jgi:hypothetical protein